MITSTTHNIYDGNITVAEGSNITLKCEANGTSNYQWRRVSGPFPMNINAKDEQTLTIYKITVSNGGEYYCEVDDGGEKVSSMRVQVTARSE